VKFEHDGLHLEPLEVVVPRSELLELFSQLDAHADDDGARAGEG
jgi:hypothetical protein